MRGQISHIFAPKLDEKVMTTQKHIYLSPRINLSKVLETESVLTGSGTTAKIIEDVDYVDVNDWN